jgi:magnesium-transporting ATPase (P-type)
MPLVRLLQNSAFEPEMIETMSLAFEEACRMLGLATVEDPLRELVASKIIECAQTGVRDRMLLRDCALKAIQD